MVLYLACSFQLYMPLTRRNGLCPHTTTLGVSSSGRRERSLRTSSRDLAFRGFRVAPISIRFLTLKNQGIPDCHLVSAGLVLSASERKSSGAARTLINVLIDLNLTPC